MFKALLTSLLIATLSLNAAAAAAPAARQAQVREKGAEVMPFSLDRTVHTFDKTPAGGVQRVRTRGDAVEQLERIRMHLRQIARSFADAAQVPISSGRLLMRARLTISSSGVRTHWQHCKRFRSRHSAA